MYIPRRHWPGKVSNRPGINKFSNPESGFRNEAFVHSWICVGPTMRSQWGLSRPPFWGLPRPQLEVDLHTGLGFQAKDLGPYLQDWGLIGKIGILDARFDV